jgi:hypothetical protein
LLMSPSKKLFQFPSLAIMSIAATRMHRALVDYASGSTEMSDMLSFPSFSALTIDIVIIARPTPSGTMLTPSRDEPPLYRSHLIGLRYLRTRQLNSIWDRNPANVAPASALTGSDVTHKTDWLSTATWRVAWRNHPTSTKRSGLSHYTPFL